jgi:hypothetical protein
MNDQVHALFTQILTLVWQTAKSDAGFRQQLLADPQATLNKLGLSDVNQFINNLETSDSAAIEAGLKSGESNPSC